MAADRLRPQQNGSESRGLLVDRGSPTDVRWCAMPVARQLHLLSAPLLAAADVSAALVGAERPYVLESGGEHELSRFLLAGCGPIDALRVDDARDSGEAALEAL